MYNTMKYNTKSQVPSSSWVPCNYLPYSCFGSCTDLCYNLYFLMHHISELLLVLLNNYECVIVKILKLKTYT